MSEEKVGGTSIFLKIGIVFIIGIVILLILGYLYLGPEQLKKIAEIVLLVIVGVSIAAVVIGFLVWLFNKKKIDVLSKRNDEIIKACKSSKIPFKQELWFRGDKYISTRKIGDIIGYAMESAHPTEVVRKDEKNRPYLERVDKGDLKPLVLIAFAQGARDRLPLIGKPKLFAGTIDDIYGGLKSLSGQRVFLDGTTFGPSLYDMYFLAKHWPDTTIIDKTIKDDVHRYTLQEFMRENKSIFDSAINLDQQFVKTKEISNVEQIPGQGGR